MIIFSLLLGCGLIALLLTIWSKGSWLEKLYATGSLAVLIAFVVLVYLGFTARFGYFFAAVGLVALWYVGAMRPMLGRDLRYARALIARLCAARGCPEPRLEQEYRYGFPAFTLTFASLADRRRAEAAGCVAEFRQALQVHYADYGTPANRFDVSYAVSVEPSK